MFYKFAYVICSFVFFIFFRTRYIGKENIPKGGALVCANHSGLSDPVFLLLCLGISGNHAIMAKSELFKVPFLNAIIRSCGAFPINRGKPDIESIKYALKELKNDKKLLMFPEGTRLNVEEARAGAGLFALKGGKPVIPVYISSSKKLFGRVDVIIGKPVDLSINEKRGSEAYKKAANIILQRIRELPGEVVN